MTQRIRWAIAAAGLALAFALALAVTGCAAAVPEAATATVHQVSYDVAIDPAPSVTIDDGSGLGPDAATADMTFEGPDGTIQQTGQAVPWTYTRAATAGDFLYVSAQNSAGGEITCTISVDGQQVKTSTSSGDYAICQADGTL
jgi:hypothetical protein